MKKQNHKRLAEGEVTGHSHRAVSKDAEIYADENDSRELNAPSGTIVKHEEHNPISIPPGRFVVMIQQEIDPFEKAIRKVVD